uniref:Uncharacterized protein n=1 Tax=Panagrolaimus davidi TaxID=227884 RepID=A0A914QAC4_9BILA
MFGRVVGNFAFVTAKLVQSQNHVRLLNASAVIFKEKTIGGEIKEGAELFTKKGKEIYQKGKEAINNPAETTADAYHDLVHEVKTQADKIKDKMNVSKCGRGTGNSSASADPRGSQKHVENQIKENEKEFSKVDKKLGGSGKPKGGYDPKTQ